MLATWFPLLLFVVLVALAVACRRSPVAAWTIMLVLGAGFVFGIAFVGVEMGPFAWIKSITLLASVAAFNAIRFTKLGERPWPAKLLWILLVVNILEAAVVDFVDGYVFNASVGIGLVLTLGSWSQVRIETDGKRDISWPIQPAWVIAYTLWNFAFVVHAFTRHASDHVAVLGAALLWLVIDREAWLQARCYTLSLYVLGIILAIEVFHLPWPRSTLVIEPEVYLALVSLAALSLLVHLAAAWKSRASAP